MKDDVREREFHLGTKHTIQKKAHGSTIGDNSHFVQLPIVESAAIKRSNVVPASGGHIACFPDLPIEAPPTFSSDIGKKNIFSAGTVQNPQGAARSGANTCFRHAVDIHRDALFWGGMKYLINPQGAASPPLLANSSSHLEDTVGFHRSESALSSFKEGSIHFIPVRLNDPVRKIVLENNIGYLSLQFGGTGMNAKEQ
jgi:hypothetical protein